ncbi:MAG: hypothetical protein AAF824_19325 [Bacteroidota bacterium]
MRHLKLMQGKQKNREEILKDIFGQEEWEEMQEEIQNRDETEPDLAPKHQDLLNQANGIQVNGLAGKSSNLPVKYEEITLKELEAEEAEEAEAEAEAEKEAETGAELQAEEPIELIEKKDASSFWDFTKKSSPEPVEPPPVLQPWETMEHMPFTPEGVEEATQENGQAGESFAKPKTHEEILGKNTNYIFIFGYTGSGKSTVLTALNMYMRQHYRVILNQLENKEGIRLIHEMMHDLESGEFPQPTSVGKITEYDAAFTMEGQNVNVTFLEMAGEDLKGIDVEDEEEGLADHVEAYLTCPGISISFLLVADYERVVKRKEDKLILQFLSYLYNQGIDMSRVGVVLSKFDKGVTDQNVEEVIQTYLPQVDKWLTSGDIAHPRVFPFSIGDVLTIPGQKASVSDIDLEDCGQIVPWLHQVLSLPGSKAAMSKKSPKWASQIKGMLGW